jgi:hypothetical protein
MIGASMNIRRSGEVVRRRKGDDHAQSDGPTAERLSKTGGHFTIGDDKQGGRIYTVRDTPLDRLFGRNAITGAEFAALQKYRHHWYHAGLDASMGSVDLNRIFSSDPGSMSGMAKTEAQAHHRQQWRTARENLGKRVAVVVDAVVCQERLLDAVGFEMGWRSRPQAIAAATEMIRDAGYRLARLWGIG